MTNGLLALLAFTPISILFILMVWARWPAVKAMPVAWAVTMICVHNIIAACATVGLTGVEGIIIKRNTGIVAIYGFIAGVLGLLIVYAGMSG